MGRRGKYSGKSKRGKKTQFHKGDNRFIVMLDISRVEYFQYDAKEVMQASNVEPKVWEPMLSSIIAKASRNSINEALDYIDQKVEEEVLPEKVAAELDRLLRKYRRNR